MRLVLPLLFCLYLISFAQDSVFEAENCSCRFEIWGELVPGEKVKLYAISCGKHRFYSWSDSKFPDFQNYLQIDIYSPVISFIVPDRGFNPSANFKTLLFVIKVWVDPHGAGRIKMDDSFIIAGRSYPAFNAPELSIKIDQNYCFIGWHSDDIYIGEPDNQKILIEIKDSDIDYIEITALFGYKVIMQSYPEKGGRVFIKDNRSCFQFNEEFDIYALPEEGYDFIYWKAEIWTAETNDTPIILYSDLYHRTEEARFISNIHSETTVIMANSHVIITGYFSKKYPDF